MKRSSWRWYFAWGIMVASLSMLLFMMTAGPAMAWTQNLISLSCNQNGLNCHVVLCGNDPSQPCLLWQEPRNTSIKLYFYMDPSLTTALGVNFVPVIQSAFDQYNKILAWSPFLYQWRSGDPTVGGSYTMLPASSFPACDVYAGTFSPSGQIPSGDVGPLEHGLNPARGVVEYYQFILYPPVSFNANIHWNTNMQYSDDGNCNVSADAKKVAAHETGHVMGLGHTYKTNPDGSPYPAIMHQGAVPWNTLQPDDIGGVAGIYPGNQQNS